MYFRSGYRHSKLFKNQTLSSPTPTLQNQFYLSLTRYTAHFPRLAIYFYYIEINEKFSILLTFKSKPTTNIMLAKFKANINFGSKYLHEKLFWIVVKSTNIFPNTPKNRLNFFQTNNLNGCDSIFVKNCPNGFYG